MGEDPSEVRHQVEEARENLGDTVEALAYKANAPKRFKEQAAAKVQDARIRGISKLDHTKERISSDPRAAKLRDHIQTVKSPGPNGASTSTYDAGAGVDERGRSARLQRTAREQMQGAAEVAKRHPEATASAGIGIAAGIIIGRITARN
jgi:hypothetical protein